MSWFGDTSLTPLQETKTGGWHKNANQTVNTTGAPSTVSLTWQQSSFGDTSTISQNTVGGQTFTVNEAGIYSLNCALQYANLGSATLTDTTFRIILLCNRAGNSANILTTTFDYPNNTPTNPTHFISGVFELQVGDQLTWQTQQYLQTGSFTVNGHPVGPTAFDLNTYWSWQLVKST